VRALERYADGFIVRNTGKQLKQETKKKISQKLTGRVVGPEIAYKAIETKRSNRVDLAPFRGRSHSNESIAHCGHATWVWKPNNATS
jgi:hypothetical protein